MSDLANIENAQGLEPADKATLEALLHIRTNVTNRNEKLRNYYEGDFEPPTIGIDTIPDTVHVDMHCDWPRKAVTSVSERARLDCFAFEGNVPDPTLARVVRDNDMVGAYNRHVSSELMQGCMFGTVNKVNTPGTAAVRYHTAQTAVGEWDVAHGRLGSGFVIADARRTRWSPQKPVPVQVNMHIPGSVIVLTQNESARWVAEKLPQPLDRPLMEAFAFRPTGIKPFGASRITKTVMDLTDEVVRTLQNMAVSAALYAHPQKYLLGLTEDQYDEMSKQSKWLTAVSSMILGEATEDGKAPTLGQLPAVSPQPYVELIRAYASLFSGATGVPLNSLGIVQDNPSSAEAIDAAREDIVIAAQDLIESNSVSLRNLALMSMAVAEDKTIDQLSDHQKTVMAHFKDPKYPSIVSQADAMIKIASVDEGFAGTNVFYEQLGFDQATRDSIKTEKVKAANSAAINALFGRGE